MIHPRKPNLFLIGAMKSGTSYLRKLLHAHPAIFMCDPDEPSYFVDSGRLKVVWRDMWERGYWRSEENYLALFKSAGSVAYLGEASTNYSKLPLFDGVADRIRDFDRQARLIYIMRDPIGRTISHYWHMVRYHAEARSLADAVRSDLNYTAVSHYAMQITPFLERFGRDRLAILTFEAMIRDPVVVARNLYDWLGLDADAAELGDFANPEHTTPAVIAAPSWYGLPRRLAQGPVLRHIVKRLPKPVSSTLRRLTTSQISRASVELHQAIDFLRPIQRQQTQQLSSMLQRSFPEWDTLYATGGTPRAQAPDAMLRDIATAGGER